MKNLRMSYRLLVAAVWLTVMLSNASCSKSGSLGVFDGARRTEDRQPVVLQVVVAPDSFTDDQRREEFESEYRLLVEEIVTNTGRFKLVDRASFGGDIPTLEVQLKRIALIDDFPTNRRVISSFADVFRSSQELLYLFSDSPDRPFFSITDRDSGREIAKLSLENEDKAIDLGYWALVQIDYDDPRTPSVDLSQVYENGVYLMGGQEWQSLTIGGTNPTETSWRVSNRARLQETTFNTLHWAMVRLLDKYDRFRRGASGQ